MASPVTVSDLLAGVGEFLKLTEHLRNSLLPKEDRDKDPSTGFEPYNTAAWAQAVNDARDLHGADISEPQNLSEEIQTIIKAAVCNLIVGKMLDQNSLHEKDRNAKTAAKFFKRYRAIIGRTLIATAAGRTANIGRSRRLVQA